MKPNILILFVLAVLTSQPSFSQDLCADLFTQSAQNDKAELDRITHLARLRAETELDRILPSLLRGVQSPQLIAEHAIADVSRTSDQISRAILEFNNRDLDTVESASKQLQQLNEQTSANLILLQQKIKTPKGTFERKTTREQNLLKLGESISKDLKTAENLMRVAKDEKQALGAEYELMTDYFNQLTADSALIDEMISKIGHEINQNPTLQSKAEILDAEVLNVWLRESQTLRTLRIVVGANMDKLNLKITKTRSAILQIGQIKNSLLPVLNQTTQEIKHYLSFRSEKPKILNLDEESLIWSEEYKSQLDRLNDKDYFRTVRKLVATKQNVSLDELIALGTQLRFQPSVSGESKDLYQMTGAVVFERAPLLNAGSSMKVMRGSGRELIAPFRTPLLAAAHAFLGTRIFLNYSQAVFLEAIKKLDLSSMSDNEFSRFERFLRGGYGQYSQVEASYNNTDCTVTGHIDGIQFFNDILLKNLKHKWTKLHGNIYYGI